MRQEKFKMERQGLIEIGDEIEISEYQSFMNYSYIIEPAVAMSGCYPNAQRIKSRKGIVKNIRETSVSVPLPVLSSWKAPLKKTRLPLSYREGELGWTVYYG